MSDTQNPPSETETPTTGAPKSNEIPVPPCCVVPPEPDGGVTAEQDES